ncbi:unnamed protein product [Adineta steineri]|uniref:Uncharacterized protein n=1 Tax=Adineta steineri TaxID=433720 RepID=A0A813SXH5_9BILA|nr:unnamed protein product [Adineta steineri]
MSSNSWNDFQHEHAGEGLDQTDMSEMYHAEQDAGESSTELTSTTDINDTAEDLTNEDNNSAQTIEADSSPDNISSINNEEISKSGNQWNDFQHEHAGEGLNQTDMSEMYHAEQDAGESSTELTSTADMNNTSEDLTNEDNNLAQTTEAGSNPDNRSNIENENEENSKSGNQWNDFEHQHAGEGLNQTEMSDMYHAEQDAGESSNGLTSTTDMNDKSGGLTNDDNNLSQTSEVDSNPDNRSNIENENEEISKSGNQWNDFQHEHAGEGLSQAGMSKLYHDKQNVQNSEYDTTLNLDTTEIPVEQLDNRSISSNNTFPMGAENVNTNAEEPSKNESTSKNNNDSIEVNPWNEFQREHKGEGKTSSELAEMYQEKYNKSSSPKLNSIDEHSIQCNGSSDNNINDVNNNLSDQSQNQLNDPPKNNSNNQINEELSSSFLQNKWNQFEHERKGQGLTHQQIAALYHQQHEKTTKNPETDSIPPAINDWNQFEHEHKNQGLTHQQMAALYHQQHEQTKQNSQVDSASSATNEWNQFEHEHKNKGLTNQQMAALYHQQQGQIINNVHKDSGNCVSNDRNKLEYEQSNLKSNRQKQRVQKPKPEVKWNLFQHLHRGKHLTKQEIADKYNQFKENEQTFKWKDDYQLVLTNEGKLTNPDSPVDCEAMKTGLFDEQYRLRRKGEIPYSVFYAKMVSMGITDRSKISSMHLNTTGSPSLRTANLRKYTYKQHAAVNTTRRDPDHILELQVIVPELRKEHLDDETFHMLRCLLNSESNIESRGVKVNRYIKGVANRGIARNRVKLVSSTFKQEEIQAQQADYLADICRKEGFLGAETVLRRAADKCNSLRSIHNQLMQLKANTTDPNEENERKRHLSESIHLYESKYGALTFFGSNLTEYPKKILDEAHSVQQ